MNATFHSTAAATAALALMLSAACQADSRTDRLLAPDATTVTGASRSAAPAPGPSYPAEHAYYNGRVYEWQFPTQKSADRQELIVGPGGCFRAGVVVPEDNAAPTVRLYAIHLPGATLHHCPGEPTVALHDHVLSAVPGVPGYSTHWHNYNVFPGPQFDPAHSPMPITSIAQLEAAAAAGQIVIVDSGKTFHAVVIGPAQ